MMLVRLILIHVILFVTKPVLLVHSNHIYEPQRIKPISLKPA
jgi:hypothetical protein